MHHCWSSERYNLPPIVFNILEVSCYNSRTIILLHCKYWMNITPWASLKSLVKPCNQIIYVCLDLYQRITTSHDVTFSRIQSRNFEILKRCYIKFGTICKYDLCCIWKLSGNKKESLTILASFVWTRYLVQTPGRLGSAHPMPQLMIPARNQRLSSLLWTTRGPPESPWGRKRLFNMTTCYSASRWMILYLTWVPPTLFSASTHKNVRNHLKDECYEQNKKSWFQQEKIKISFSHLVPSCR